MRRLVAVLAAMIVIAACTPSQVATIMHHDHPTKGDVQIAEAFNRAQKPADSGAQFLRAAAALHNDPFLVCTRGHESDTAGGYRAYNPDGPYFGAYQFLQGTWNRSAAHAGFPQLVGVNILNVPGFYQDSVAIGLYHWQGKSPWGGRC